jgi:murein DD-endopeptidase MepM/ murein hydrolase activator NlpD
MQRRCPLLFVADDKSVGIDVIILTGFTINAACRATSPIVHCVFGILHSTFRIYMDPSVFVQIALLSAVLAISSPNVTLPTPAAGYTIYVVQSGDTLSSVAAQFSTTVQIVEQANHLADPTTLVPGEKLQVPLKTATATPAISANGTTYTVKAGDTLAAIAASFNLTVDDLAKANAIKDINSLAVGQVLIISGKASPLPDGIALFPSTVKQGNTLEFRITAAAAVTATGTFNGANLHFVAENGALFALRGFSQCAALGIFPVQLTTTSADGQTTTLTFSARVNATNYPVQNITLTQQMAGLLDPAIIYAEDARVARTVAPFLPEQMWNGPFHPPLAVQNPIITAVFGERRSYNGGAPGLCGHEGQDFAVDAGTPVYAPAGGIVALAEPLKERGNVVFIDHGLSVYSGFYHLSEIDVKAGQRVNTGDLVGKVGTTGFSTGNHLHWSMWVNGVYVNPIEWTTRTIP